MVKKIFLAKFQKLASERNFDVEQFFFNFCHKQIKINPARLVHDVRDKKTLHKAILSTYSDIVVYLIRKKYFLATNSQI